MTSHPDAVSLSTGDQFTSVLVDQLSRAHIAQYAGASGDFNLVHVDEVYATAEAGRTAVIAHGMLTMGLTATFVTSLVGHGSLRSFGGRFLAPVMPGDRLECVATVTAAEGGHHPTVTLRVETRLDDGSLVFAGDAIAVVARTFTHSA